MLIISDLNLISSMEEHIQNQKEGVQNSVPKIFKNLGKKGSKQGHCWGINRGYLLHQRAIGAQKNLSKNLFQRPKNSLNVNKSLFLLGCSSLSWTKFDWNFLFFTVILFSFFVSRIWYLGRMCLFIISYSVVFWFCFGEIVFPGGKTKITYRIFL